MKKLAASVQLLHDPYAKRVRSCVVMRACVHMPCHVKKMAAGFQLLHGPYAKRVCPSCWALVRSDARLYAHARHMRTLAARFKLLHDPYAQRARSCRCA